MIAKIATGEIDDITRMTVRTPPPWLRVLVAQVVNYVRATGRFSQWFFLRGDAHPLRSIGYFAASAIFVIVIIGMVFSSLDWTGNGKWSAVDYYNLSV